MLAQKLNDICACHFAQSDTLLITACRHGSNLTGDNYQRLEFLGDRVLGMGVATILYKLYPDSKEGGLAKRQAQLVSEETLDKVAREMDIDDHIEMVGNAISVAVRADVFEAIIGAVYLHAGIESALKLVHHYWYPLAKAMRNPPENPRSILQEWTMKNKLPQPNYTEIARKGTDHAPQFCMSVSVKNLGTEQAWSNSKQQAKVAAAQKLIQKIS